MQADEYAYGCLRTCPTQVEEAAIVRMEGEEPYRANWETLVMCALGICGEGGEFADLIKKTGYQGHDFDERHALLELGDVLYYVSVAALALGYTLTDVMEANVEKLRKRYPDGFSAERSVHREEGDL